MGAALGKLGQPNLLPIPSIILLLFYLNISSSSPVVEILQLVHDPVHMTIIVMRCQVINSAAQGLASIKKWIKPICVASSRGRAY